MKKWFGIFCFLGIVAWGRTALHAQSWFDVKLWEQGLPNTNGRDGGPERQQDGIYTPEIRVFLPDSAKATGRIILACPGGGYSFIALGHEGYDWAPYFNEKYSVTISTDAIKEHLIPAEPDPYRCDMDTSKEYHRNLRDLSLHYEDVVDQMFIQLDGLSFVERAFQELRTKCHKAAYWSNSNAGYDRKGDTLRFGGYFCSCDERWGHEEWRLAERMQDIFTAVAHYETNTFGRFPAGFSELLGYSDVSTSQFQFPTCQKLVQLRMFKNGRVDLKFKTASIAKEFAETYLDYSC